MMNLLLTTLVWSHPARAQSAGEVAELKRKLAAVTAEAEALWIYVESGPEQPNIHALNKAMALYEKRRRGGR